MRLLREGTVSRWIQLLLSLAALAVWAGVIALIIFFSEPFTASRRWLLGISTFLFGVSLLYFSRYRDSCRYRLTDEYIEYRCGLLYETCSRIRLDAVMMVTEIRLPIPFIRRTCSLLVSAMGGSILLPLLYPDDAQFLLETLSERDCPHVQEASETGETDEKE